MANPRLSPAVGRPIDPGAPRTAPALVALLLVALAFAGCSGGPGASPPASTASASATDAASATPSGAASVLPSGTTMPTSDPSDSPDPHGIAVLVGAGDIASCGSSGDERTADLLDAIGGTVFSAGDNVYDSGTSAEFADCYAPTWGRHLERTLPVPGNHEYRTTGAAGYFAYFGARAGDPSTGWYATDLGAWRIYGLNSNCGEIGGCEAGSDQERWLRADLTANPRRCSLAIWHHPLFSSGDHGNDPMTRALWQALADGGAEIVVTGHDHDYERFGPQDAAGAADPGGIVEFVVGTGGRSHYPFGSRAPVANSLVRDDTAYGVVRFELADDGWTSTFVPVVGATFTDSASGRCH